MKNNKMFLLSFVAVAMIFSQTPAFADVGGDIGGGGVAKLLELTPQEKAGLKLQQDKNAKFQQWLQGLDEAKEMRVLQKLYDLHVEPQLK